MFYCIKLHSVLLYTSMKEPFPSQSRPEYMRSVGFTYTTDVNVRLMDQVFAIEPELMDREEVYTFPISTTDSSLIKKEKSYRANDGY